MLSFQVIAVELQRNQQMDFYKKKYIEQVTTILECEGVFVYVPEHWVHKVIDQCYSLSLDAFDCVYGAILPAYEQYRK